MMGVNRFADRQTERLYNRQSARRLPPEIRARAWRRIRRLVTARSLEDIAKHPSYRLEALRGDRRGQYSIRINRQWRVCFVWTSLGAMEIEIVDYH